jgi:hypothetical protein
MLAEVSRVAALVKSAFERHEIGISSHQPERVMMLPMLLTPYQALLLL